MVRVGNWIKYKYEGNPEIYKGKVLSIEYDRYNSERVILDTGEPVYIEDIIGVCGKDE